MTSSSSALVLASPAAAPPELPGVLAGLAPILDTYGYVAVAGLILIEDFGVPSPGETVLILGAIYAGTGRLNVVLVALLGFLGAVIGDNIGYLIGRFGGRRLVEHYGRYVRLTPERIDRAERFFNRYGGGIVVVARFVEGLRQFNGIVAGMTAMPWQRFLAYNVLGAALWVGLWASLGDLAGGHIDTIYPVIVRYELYLGIAIGVVLLAVLARAVLKRRRPKHTR
ncbi:DedA family protein [Prauserella cavernicola]|uniref:DedA family protein n=1 Tax=Prauserella cavernicola TaxID=2800127 RepID=A0A934QWA0_9PSEU|nr:DedA family protein [Prauserella cavernicola]MBK1787576.1 DedA family protein [Prauserella cavernicola]